VENREKLRNVSRHRIFAWFFPVHHILISRRCPPSFVKIGQGFKFSWIFFKTLYFPTFQKFKTTSRWLGFSTTLCRPHSGGICDNSQPRILKNHDFENFMIHGTPPSHKIKLNHQNHQTWLCTTHTKINYFCHQTFPTSPWRHLWGLSPATFPKPWFSFFTPHTTKSQNLAKSPNLAIHQPYQDHFLLLANFSYITLEAFVRFESSHISKTMIFVFHPSHHQVTKSSQHTKITKLGLAPTIPRTNPFAPKLFPHYFGGICEVWVQPHFQNHNFHFSPLTPPSHKI